ncbi:hypothetical protein H4S07_001243 [Coemansia furcata]|uniref:Uncharacterized protein n=1 Tax=Coemansia furcata TaxID=417177 RepID=A0ACC1LNU3_9FUNG|nr:hypothetical protein H4S07_001243 [Coemansia furcata]
MGKLGLLSDFDCFEERARAIFRKCTANVPVTLPMRKGNIMLEDDYVQCFFDLYHALDLELANSILATRFHASAYLIMDKQNAPVHRSTLKPAVVFAFASAVTPAFGDLFPILEAKIK